MSQKKLSNRKIILLIVIVSLSCIILNLVKLFSAECNPSHSSCVVYGFSCTSPQFYEGGIRFRLQNTLRDMGDFFIEIPGCENHTIESFKMGESKSFIFSEGKCVSTGKTWCGKIGINWLSSETKQRAFEQPYGGGEIKIHVPIELKEPWYKRIWRKGSEDETNSTCGNGECEDYELLHTCEEDCQGLEKHTYGFCRRVSWDGVSVVRIVGTDTYLKTPEMLGPDLEPRPTCGRDGLGTSKCFYCYNVTEIREPIFEIRIKDGAGLIPICDELVLKYFVDGEDQGCQDNKSEYIGRYAHYPYDQKRYGQFEEAKT